MIQLFPTNPGVTDRWSVTIDFTKNGLPKIEKTFHSLGDAIFYIETYLTKRINY